VHLAAGDPAPDSLRIVGRSCHDAGEVWRLVREDYVTLSPVYPTATKPGYGPPLTARGAARVAGGVPWLGLGGVDSPERAAECAAAGAAGVAVLGAVMRPGDPAAATRELAEAFAAGRGQAVEAIPLAASASASAPAPAPATALARAIPIGAQSKAPGGGPAVGFAGGATGPGGRGWEAEVTGGGA
jgi:thiamine-phosphate pyrophosphorylase